MSTRARIVLTNTRSGETYKGSRAVALVVGQGVAQKILSIDFPINWSKMLKSAKLKFLAKYLSKEWELKIIQEPRGTRKEKSLYWQTVNGKAKKAPKEGDLRGLVENDNPAAIWDDIVGENIPRVPIQQQAMNNPQQYIDWAQQVIRRRP